MKNRLKDIRLALDLTQEKMAELAETSRVQIARLEGGARKMTQDWMERLAHGLKSAGYNDIEAWHFIKNPNDQISNEERAYLEIFRELPPEKRQTYTVIGQAMVQESKSTSYTIASPPKKDKKS
jgi:transcriptional regulator with XRE-family HTH domain